MDNHFGWILDVLVIVIAAYVLISNAKRGLTKVIVLCSGYIVATLLSSMLSGFAAPLLYETVARDNSISTLETVNSKVDLTELFTDAMEKENFGFYIDSRHVEKILNGEKRGKFDDLLFDYVVSQTGAEPYSKERFVSMLNDAFISGYSKELQERTPRYVGMYFRRTAVSDPQLMRDFVTISGDEKMTAQDRAVFIEDRFSAEPSQLTLRIFVYLIIFSVLMVFAALLSAGLQNRIFFNVTEKTDHFLGGLIGLLEVAAMLVLLTLIVRLIILLSGDQASWCNETMIESTGVFRYLYHRFNLMI
ncbi:MAG TPA: hypothetical protein DDX71_01775 [Ruminococcus sp.]|nr:hypothetical protein [Ruminococcus sp.]